MEPRIVTLDKFTTVGMPYLGKNEHDEISGMWDRFMTRMGEIKHRLPGSHVSYGICSPNPEGLVDYVAALPVDSLDDIPAGMVAREVPAQTYVVMQADGLADIQPTYRRILEEWLPASGRGAGDGPDFEYYPEIGDPSKVLVYFPIR